MTEQQQDGPAPDVEATASTEHEAPEQSVATIAVADEPATPSDPVASDRQRHRGKCRGQPSGHGRGSASRCRRAATEPEAAAEPATEPEAAAPAPQPAAVTAAEPRSRIQTPAEANGLRLRPRTPPSWLPSWPTPRPPPRKRSPSRSPRRDLGPEPTTMEELLAEQDSDIKSFKHGDVVEGTVVRIDKDEILVDIGAKSEGVVSNRELYGRNAESGPSLGRRRHGPRLRPPAGVAGGPRRPLPAPGRPRAQVALDAGAVRVRA